MSTSTSERELLINGDFATGDFTGWEVASEYFHLHRQDRRNVVVATPSPPNLSLGQSGLRASAGEYATSFWHCATDAQGTPIEGETRFFAAVIVIRPDDPEAPGDIRPLIMAATRWTKHATRFTVPSMSTIGFNIQNLAQIIVPVPDRLRNEITNGPIALHSFSIWRMS
ncbi:hypothetical protein UC34_10970 [Pandoraea vervacti]|uniref:Uncharacterized protein n=2 Tax=Pandoraea vervacti TaxID=656178 RepID=A0ABN4FNZ0_9BURK|nr:hypothetical protein UC34_10970 [Pandoraea vervacti]